MITSKTPINHISTAAALMINDMLHKYNAHSPIRYFDYQRIYHNKEMICLTSNINFLSDRIHLDEPFIEPHLSEGVFLAEEVFPAREIALDHQHDMFTGICFVKKKLNYTETAFFASNHHNKNCVSFYLNNTQYLKHFICEFKNKFSEVISKAEQSKIKIADKLLTSTNSLQSQNKTHVPVYNEVQQLLSNQESIVLQYLIKGKTQHEIANTMNISRSSVSTFIYRTMQKLNCKSRSQLIDLACKHGFVQFQLMDY